MTARKRCRPGAWGSPDRCLTHEGLPLINGRCVEGRSTIVLRPDWAAWRIASNAVRKLCGARAFLLSPPENDRTTRDPRPFETDLAPFTRGEVGALTGEGRAKPPVVEDTLPGMGEWLRRHGR